VDFPQNGFVAASQIMCNGIKVAKKLWPTVCDRLKAIQTIRENCKERFPFKGYWVIRIYN